LKTLCAFARRKVAVAGGASGGAITLAIEDDGPGIAANDASALMVRGARLDQAGGGARPRIGDRPGDGRSHRRQDHLRQIALGGLRVELQWPDTAAGAKPDALAAS
jgi:signal transduction histidine kinase